MGRAGGDPEQSFGMDGRYVLRGEGRGGAEHTVGHGDVCAPLDERRDDLHVTSACRQMQRVVPQ